MCRRAPESFWRPLHLSYQTEELQIEPSEDVIDAFSYLDGKQFSVLNACVYRSALRAHSVDGVPCCELSLNSPLNEQALGSLFWFFLLSAYLSATLLDVDPFEQEGVESYKKNMYAELGKKEAT
jgi:glucose-6-phosphate isomerase